MNRLLLVGALIFAGMPAFAVGPTPVAFAEDTCTIVGTEENDVLYGTTSADVICGLEGSDTIYGYGGDDIIVGGSGDDQIVGGSGDDDIAGNGGSDDVTGGTGSDSVDAGAGDDIIVGGSGDDQLWGGGGDDELVGSSGGDWLSGDSGTDDVDGGIGIDYCNSDPGDISTSCFYDSAAPRVVAVSVLTSTIDTGSADQRVVFRVRAKDSGSGVSGVAVYFSSDSRTYGAEASIEADCSDEIRARDQYSCRVSGTANDVVYEMSFVVPRYSPRGVFKISSARASDLAGNLGTVDDPWKAFGAKFTNG